MGGERLRKSTVNNVRESMNDKMLETPLKRKVFRQYSFYLSFKTVFSEDSLLKQIPPFLSNRVVSYIHGDIIKGVPMIEEFEELYPGFCGMIFPYLRPAYFQPDDFIIKCGTVNRDMYFV